MERSARCSNAAWPTARSTKCCCTSRIRGPRSGTTSGASCSRLSLSCWRGGYGRRFGRYPIKGRRRAGIDTIIILQLPDLAAMARDKQPHVAAGVLEQDVAVDLVGERPHVPERILLRLRGDALRARQHVEEVGVVRIAAFDGEEHARGVAVDEALHGLHGDARALACGQYDDGERIKSRGWLHKDGCAKITVQMLRTCGCTFPSGDITDETGFGAPVQLVIDESGEYDGDRESSIDPGVALEATIPFLRTEVIPGAGDMAPLTDPHVVDPMVGEFIAKVESGWQGLSIAA